jgi:hypothetical protein
MALNSCTLVLCEANSYSTAHNFSRSLTAFQDPMSNEFKHRVFEIAFKSRPDWELPQSEVQEALKKTRLAVSDNMRKVRKVDRNVDGS